MVALCGSERETDQLVAVRPSSTPPLGPSRATFIITNGVSLLKEIYKTTKNEKIKIRALVVSGLGTRPCTRYQGCQNEWDVGPLSLRKPSCRHQTHPQASAEQGGKQKTVRMWIQDGKPCCIMTVSLIFFFTMGYAGS